MSQADVDLIRGIYAAATAPHFAIAPRRAGGFHPAAS